MVAFIRRQSLVIAMLGALGLASISGFFAARALGVGFVGAPTKTTTVEVGAGATGPAGPPGPAGPAGPPGPAGTGGADQCPTGSDFEAVVLVSPGHGPVEVWTCVKQ